ncbi:hypothetical protein [Candidatus Odyssella acanthamoebae]|uniref:Lipoprotein n=1 Tax=Candidatus Odyssella acanthamoebae TaxID=91604 RepID=A0A077AUZ2_9PROT|nr:hypothetical protein [Candidatus Paracaedibacter acanthamoebae]AIK96982.1 hypothetical protein ID47_09945 [Candidatus Paracaedibacter acanthamoebae]
MKRFRGIALAFSTALLSCCTTPSIVKSSPTEKNFQCKLVNATATLRNQNLGQTVGLLTAGIKQKVNFGIKKINGSLLKFWIKFLPRSAAVDPLERPGVILKLSLKGKAAQTYRLSGGQKHEGFSPEGFNQGNFSYDDIWPSARYFGEKAVSFDIRQDQFDQILKSDTVEFIIQTHYDPLIIFLEKESFSPLLDFKKECLSQIAPPGN